MKARFLILCAALLGLLPLHGAAPVPLNIDTTNHRVDTSFKIPNTLTVTVESGGGITLSSGGTLTAASGSTVSLFGTSVTGKTGTGSFVLSTSPTLVTPTLGAATATSINGLAISTSTGTLTITNGKTASFSNTLTFSGTDSSSVAFGAGGTVAYQGGTLAQFASTTSSQLTGVLSDETGSGAIVCANSPTLVTPTLGAATATSLNGLTISSSTGTLTITNGKTASISNTLTFSGTDSSSVAFGAGGTVAYQGGTLAQFASTTSSQLTGVLSDETGTGAIVCAASPALSGTPTVAGKVAITPAAESQNTLTVKTSGGNPAVQLGTYPGAESYGMIWLGNVTPSNINYFALSDSGNVAINGSGRVDIRSADVNKVSLSSAGVALCTAVVTKTSNYTATDLDHTILCDATGGAITITLPAASGCKGRVYVIKKIDSSGNSVTIDGNASETIDGSTTKSTTTQYASWMIISDAANWWIE